MFPYYANDSELEAAVDTIENMQMASNENVNDLYRRLAAAGRGMAGALLSRRPDDEILREQIRFHRLSYKGTGAFLRHVSHAEALHNSYLNVPIKRRTILVKSSDGHLDYGYDSSSSSSSDYRVVQGPTGPSTFISRK